jgi:hypothetical protein
MHGDSIMWPSDQVIASELLSPDGHVEPNGTDTSFHFDVWTLSDGPQSLNQHEYIEARYWQVEGAPEPPSRSTIMGWKTWYPYHKPGQQPRDDEFAGTTRINSSSAALDAVYELCRYTGRVGAMDVNTDSNARQRDNCNVDAHITAMHQAAAAPAASAVYRKRNVQFLFQPDAHVHPWTEFKLFSLGAVHEYTYDTGDLSVANHTFDTV